MIGDVLKKTRNIYGFKGSEMCSLLQISPSYLSEIENNKKKPSLDLLEKYAEIYDIKVSSLILLSETLSDTDKRDNSTLIVKKMMLQLVDSMSKGTGDVNE